MSSSNDDTLLLLNNKVKPKKKTNQKYWVHPYMKKNANALGIFSVTKKLSLYSGKFKNFYRMFQAPFIILTALVFNFQNKFNNMVFRHYVFFCNIYS